jgi:LAO/AO transport system kinase
MGDAFHKPTRIAEEVLQGDERSAARLISLIEQENPEGYRALSDLWPPARSAHVVGVTGTAGAGKSTLINALAGRLLKEGKKVGIVAIDPSCSTGEGSLLGDRLRMKDAEKSQGVFIRSMAQRSYPGGICRAATGAVCVLESMGKDFVMIESIGAGQSDRELFYLADTIITVFTPEFGDEIQLMKAGLLEIGDIIVVNKCDKPGADDVMAAMQAYLPEAKTRGWKTPVLALQADRGLGIDELARSINAHGEFYQSEKMARRGEKHAHFAMTLLKEEIWKRFSEQSSRTSLAHVLEEMREGRLNPYSAVRQLGEEFEHIMKSSDEGRPDRQDDGRKSKET